MSITWLLAIALETICLTIESVHVVGIPHLFHLLSIDESGDCFHKVLVFLCG
ncbi:MAG: hypothetical protein HCA25_04765 [Dolichospermum sp. DET50]|nr:hypothetical protein [Dolichospermum sp. DET66]MBS3031613.1 hypothetical protein [Dolichospermum sp. DET67]MBS3036824.1 hypothetical protein [Dolichospermum sp. DET50]QSX68848.1 MAG: hypothetical protein EZY12_03935 [Dolichospermum sp. DET69]